MAVYHYVKANADVGLLYVEIIAAGLPCDYVRGDSTSVDVTTPTTLTAPQVVTLDGVVSAHAGVSPFVAGPSPGNLLCNGAFVFDARGRTSAVLADGSFTLDRWYLLTQSAPAGLGKAPIATDGLAAFYQASGTPQRMGVVQFLEAANSVPRRRAPLTFSLVCASSPIRPLRMAILEWTGTADAPTKDVVNDWTSTSYVSGGFFLSTWNVLGTGLVTPTSASAPVAGLVTGTVGNGCNNLAVFIWSDGVLSATDTFQVGKADLYVGREARPWAPRLYAEELALCQRYCLQLTDQPAGQVQNTSQLYNIGALVFPVTMRTTPALLSGATFTANAGSHGTPGLVYPAPSGTGFYNSANNWTVNALIKASCVLDAEL